MVAPKRHQVPEIVQAIIDRIPAPKGEPGAPLQALGFDSQFDSYRGVVSLIRVFNGEIKEKTKLHL